jgi:hypothetical protein
MKRSIYAFMSLAFLFMSCEKEDSKQAKPAITGKWLLVNYVEEEYRPINNLVSRNETPGLPGDSLVFKEGNRLYTYSDIDGNHLESYEIVSDSILRIESEEWKIAKLTNTQLDLLSDETDIAANERSVVKAFLKRP